MSLFSPSTEHGKKKRSGQTCLRFLEAACLIQHILIILSSFYPVEFQFFRRTIEKSTSQEEINSEKFFWYQERNRLRQIILLEISWTFFKINLERYSFNFRKKLLLIIISNISFCYEINKWILRSSRKRRNVLTMRNEQMFHRQKVKAFRSKDKFHRKMGYAISRFPSGVFGVLLVMGEEEERKEEDFSFEVAGLSTVTSRRPSIATL